MADSKISALPAVTTPASTDEFAVNQGGTSKKQTRSQIHTLQSGEHLVLPQVDEAATPTLVIDGGTSGFYAPAANQIGISLGGGLRWKFTDSVFRADGINGGGIAWGGPSATVPTLLPLQSGTTTGIGSAGANQLSLIAGGSEVMRNQLSQNGATGPSTLILDLSVAPTTNPTGGGILYSEAGALKWRGSSGTVTQLAAA